MAAIVSEGKQLEMNMTMKTNGDMPAMPVTDDAGMPFNSVPAEPSTIGLTKREMLCLHVGVAETGDAELDDIIRKGNRQKIAAQIMCGLLSATNKDGDWTGNGAGAGAWAVSEADALLAELERTK